eukprot:358784-Chlamydomonas_euryale.AAC.14
MTTPYTPGASAVCDAVEASNQVLTYSHTCHALHTRRLEANRTELVVEVTAVEGEVEEEVGEAEAGLAGRGGLAPWEADSAQGVRTSE